ncbi:hypothetical protein RFI_18866 [Reticulomyxa filosa]|uniref:Uncharacterized protein n=1 Tax=Reticulomyxa filosa TaxID=46433 RepID=X6MX78_RETFI|nr:hypothetical protein RFI_18866 [Reticulomyxa filosa]|eukprot:ETO18399.1 hypothetical protein RFI_18866 [Reticulomyxa filosa]
MAGLIGSGWNSLGATEVCVVDIMPLFNRYQHSFRQHSKFLFSYHNMVAEMEIVLIERTMFTDYYGYYLCQTVHEKLLDTKQELPEAIIELILSFITDKNTLQQMTQIRPVTFPQKLHYFRIFGVVRQPLGTLFNTNKNQNIFVILAQRQVAGKGKFIGPMDSETFRKTYPNEFNWCGSVARKLHNNTKISKLSPN